jgi:glycosyltransferase involved in cell wall biosynthesis
MKKNLLLFTEAYPYGNGEQFLEDEIKYLSVAFDTITILPLNIAKTIQREIPPNVICEPGLARNTSSIRIAFEALSLLSFYPEVSSRLNSGFNGKEIKRIISCAGIANLSRKWLIKYIKDSNIDPGNTLFYSYWMTGLTFGIGFLKESYPHLSLVSRAHGHDLYEERYYPPYIPFQKKILGKLNKLFLISEHGKKYILHKYPTFAPICSVAKLGVKGPSSEKVSKCSQDGVFRILSCSFIVPVKRLPLLLEGISTLAESKPEMSFEWYHIGDGPEKELLETNASLKGLLNLKIHLLGHLPRYEVLKFYASNPIDVFVNVSSSEGISVAIMEAQSYGVPVIATAVGGSPEIVSDSNGKLLSSNPSPAEIAESVNSFLADSISAKVKRIESRKNWECNYNADKNYANFVDSLLKIP